jgi:hypothetical protein
MLQRITQERHQPILGDHWHEPTVHVADQRAHWQRCASAGAWRQHQFRAKECKLRRMLDRTRLLQQGFVVHTWRNTAV